MSCQVRPALTSATCLTRRCRASARACQQTPCAAEQLPMILYLMFCKTWLNSLTIHPRRAGVAKGNKAVVLSSGRAVDRICTKVLKYGPSCSRTLPGYSLPSKRPATPGLSLVTTRSGLTWAKAPAGAVGPAGNHNPHPPCCIPCAEALHVC